MRDQTALTISELTYAIKQNLESAFTDLRIQGEISNFKRHSSGHLYFSLKDTEAQLAAVMFRADAAQLKSLPKDGDKVVASGSLNVYPPRGNYQLLVKELSLQGVGELLLKLEELKRLIHQRGWFSKEHKKPLPSLPARIGIVTSPTGAAIRDILHVLNRRFFGVHILINPVPVQGVGAAEEIARAIDQFNRFQLADLILVARGGGSIEDLWAFNEEVVAKAIFESDIPIICSIGHETDHTIAEYVADLRAPTPSAAAEIAVGEKSEKLRELARLNRSLRHAILRTLKESRSLLERFAKQPLFFNPYYFLGARMQKLDECRDRLDRAGERLLERKRAALESCQKRMRSLSPLQKIRDFRSLLARMSRMIALSASQAVERKRAHLEQLLQTLQAIHPQNLLSKGYSLILSKERKILSSISNLSVDEKIEILLFDGRAEASIEALSAEKFTDNNWKSCYVEGHDS